MSSHNTFRPLRSVTRKGPTKDAHSDFLRMTGERVRRTRKRLGMSRKALAIQSGVSERHLASIENGSGNISIMLLKQIADATDSRVEHLVSEQFPDGEDVMSILEIARRASNQERASILEAFDYLLTTSNKTQREKRIALIGLRGAGKSSLAKLISEKTGASFAELNREIEQESGIAVPEILALYGEQGYQRLEQLCLRQLIIDSDNMILAVAGGIVNNTTAFEMLLRGFHCVWLKASPAEHISRVTDQEEKTSSAGSANAIGDVVNILEQRKEFYSRAEVTLDTSDKSLQQSAEDLGQLIKILLSDN